MVPATTSWLAALTVCPAPAGPTWTIVVPSASSTGWAAATSSSDPPTMMESVPSTAPRSPPETGASSTRKPSAATAMARAVCGLIVLMSMTSVPGAALARTPSGPSSTDSTSGESGSIVITASAPATASATLPAARPPAAVSRSRPGRLRVCPATSNPALTRLAAMGDPMMPRPMKPIVFMNTSSRYVDS
jgi:hypothetical protein